MPKQFLHRAAEHILEHHSQHLERLCVVLPSRRAALFLKRVLAGKLDKPLLGPRIIVVEELCTALAGLYQEDSLSLTFRLYACYREVYGDQAEHFESFIKWSNRVLQDFNEVDRYQVDAADMYNNLTDAKTLERWGVEYETPEMMASYLAFWKGLHPMYRSFRERLIADGVGYQGMIYRQAAEQVSSALLPYLERHHSDRLLFLGFNALNSAEEQIMTYALDIGIADILFDADSLYLDDPDHEAGMFMRRYRSTWKYFEKKPFEMVGDQLKSRRRKIHLVGVPRQVGMAKTAGDILGRLKPEKENLPEQIALVPADESLLLPLLNAIPADFGEINVTMGMALNHLALANGVLIALEAQERAVRLARTEGRKHQIYHRDLERILLHPFYRCILGENGDSIARSALTGMRRYNAPFIGIRKIREWLPGAENLTRLLEPTDPTTFLGQLAEALAVYHDRESNLGEDREAAALLHRICLRLAELFERHGLAPDLSTVLGLYRQLLREESLDFYGEPLEGLQVMGVLETRLLSFDTLIMTSVNEGILPSGKVENSFIPLDLKRHFGLPTYREKDAIYAYHFYRLLQGADEVYLLYNTENDDFGSGEPSRFIEQIRREFRYYSANEVSHELSYAEIDNSTLVRHFSLERGSYMAKELRALASRGVTPTQLQRWVNDPSEFYMQAILGMREMEEVEEIIGYNTMGDVVHGVLEDFYKPFIGRRPEDEDYARILKNLDERINTTYEAKLKRSMDSTGRNKLIQQVMIHMTRLFLAEERKRVAEYDKKGLEWIIRGTEEKLQHTLAHPDLPYPVLIRGVADRIDTLNGEWRVIDYKTGNAQPVEVKIGSIDELNLPDKKNKALQLMTYIWLLWKRESQPGKFTAGIYSLRNNSVGYLQLTLGGKREISKESLEEFELELIRMLRAIFSEDGAIEPRDVLVIDDNGDQ